jgi:hypothetical protein
MLDFLATTSLRRSIACRSLNSNRAFRRWVGSRAWCRAGARPFQILRHRPVDGVRLAGQRREPLRRLRRPHQRRLMAARAADGGVLANRRYPVRSHGVHQGLHNITDRLWQRRRARTRRIRDHLPDQGWRDIAAPEMAAHDLCRFRLPSCGNALRPAVPPQAIRVRAPVSAPTAVAVEAALTAAAVEVRARGTATNNGIIFFPKAR